MHSATCHPTTLSCVVIVRPHYRALTFSQYPTFQLLLLMHCTWLIFFMHCYSCIALDWFFSCIATHTLHFIDFFMQCYSCIALDSFVALSCVVIVSLQILSRILSVTLTTLSCMDCNSFTDHLIYALFFKTLTLFYWPPHYAF